MTSFELIVILIFATGYIIVLKKEITAPRTKENG